MFGAAFAWLPFWLFVPVAVYLYSFPWFQPKRTAAPFLLLLFLCYLQPAGVVYGLIFALLFYLTLLIKELLLVDRRAANEILTLAIVFFLLRDFYLKFNQGLAPMSVFIAFLTAGLMAFLLYSLIAAYREGGSTGPEGEYPFSPTALRMGALLGWLLFLQVLIVCLFLPADFIYQSSTAFLIAVLVFDLIPEHFAGTLSGAKILTAGAAVSVLLVLVLGSIRLGL